MTPTRHALRAGGPLGAAVGVLGACSAPVMPDRDVTALRVPAGYTLVWADEFNGSGPPDPARWEHDTGMNKQGWHNRELQYYSAAGGGNAQQQGGRLVITARAEQRPQAADWGGQRYTSARLLTRGRGEWTYGYFEVRARYSCTRGSWPAIWTLGVRGDWPAMGELDILEHVGKNPGQVFSTVHTSAGSGGHGAGASRALPDACTAFHNYQMHWTAQEIRFAIDGRTHYVYRNPGTGAARWPFDTPQFLILNLAIGGDLGGPVDDEHLPAHLEVEYVRVYQQAPAKATQPPA